MNNNPGFKWGERTYIMGVINVTPDSFSGDGLLSDYFNQPQHIIETALSKGRQFKEEGVDILDVGGESTRPGSNPVPAEQELARVIPVIQALASSGLDLPISVDTSKAIVAKTALETGAHWVNDVRALRGDPDMAKVVGQFHVPVILMHNRLGNTAGSNTVSSEQKPSLGGRYTGVRYVNLLEDVKAELLESVALAHASGIGDEYIILDPGLGFGKTVEQSLELIDRLDELRSLGYPLLVGPSRKSFIGYTLNLPPDQRLEGTAAAVAISIARGADLIRVHDVGVMVRVARLADAIVRRKLT